MLRFARCISRLGTDSCNAPVASATLSGADFSADTRDFGPVFKSIAEEIRSGYTLAYYPPEPNRRDGRLHQVRVECKRVGAIIRASRTNYQAPAK